MDPVLTVLFVILAIAVLGLLALSWAAFAVWSWRRGRRVALATDLTRAMANNPHNAWNSSRGIHHCVDHRTCPVCTGYEP